MHSSAEPALVCKVLAPRVLYGTVVWVKAKVAREHTIQSSSPGLVIQIERFDCVRILDQLCSGQIKKQTGPAGKL